jgi:hypothetical protein
MSAASAARCTAQVQLPKSSTCPSYPLDSSARNAFQWPGGYTDAHKRTFAYSENQWHCVPSPSNTHLAEHPDHKARHHLGLNVLLHRKTISEKPGPCPQLQVSHLTPAWQTGDPPLQTKLAFYMLIVSWSCAPRGCCRNIAVSV